MFYGFVIAVPMEHAMLCTLACFCLTPTVYVQWLEAPYLLPYLFFTGAEASGGFSALSFG